VTTDVALTSYAELAEVLDHLPMLLREACRARGITHPAAAKQIGIAQSTVSRLISRSGDVNLENTIQILSWLDQRDGTSEPAEGQNT
jgi:hypothetical protein